MENFEKIDAARQVVTRFLRGELNFEQNPEYFDDDILMFAVARLDKRDSEWILAEIANSEWPHELRSAVAIMLRIHYAEGQSLLGDE